MRTDNDLLELAAKAAGIVVDYRRGSDAFYYDDPETGREQWCPLDDDGQALRLAVKLRLHVNVGTEATFASDKVAGETVHWAREQHNESDPYAATRRAIVRAAAEIGKAMLDAPRVNVAPWPDFAGNPIHEGDTIVHPLSGERGKVVFLPKGADEGAKWRVDYGTGHLSSLGLQIGDKGRAVVAEPRCTCPSGDGSLAWPCPTHKHESTGMTRDYISHFEVWAKNKRAGFGNHSVSVPGQVTGKELMHLIRDEAAQAYMCQPDQILIVGVFKL